VPAIGEIAAAVRRPCDNVGDSRRDLLIATGAAIGLRGRVARDRPDQPVAVLGGVDAFDPTPRSKIIKWQRLVVTAVMATWAHI